MLIPNTDRRAEAFGKLTRCVDTVRQYHTSAVKDYRVLSTAQEISGGLDRIFTTRGAFKFDGIRDFDINHLSPEITWHVDLRRRRGAFCLCDHAGENFGHTRWIANLFLVGDHIFEQFHLFNFLEATLTDCFVRRLWCDQQKRSVVPIGCFNCCHKVGDTRAVLSDHHGHFACDACVAVRHHACAAFMRAIPEGDSSLWEDVRNRHHG